MTGPTRRLVWRLAIVAPLLIAATLTALFLYAPPLIASWLHRAVTEPTAEDYAVYSAFVDGFFSSNQPFKADQIIGPDSVVYVAGETLPVRSLGSILPLDIAALGPEDMGEDYFRQNVDRWVLEPRFRTRLRVSIVGRDLAHRAAFAGAEGLFHPQKGAPRKWPPHASPNGPFPDAPH